MRKRYDKEALPDAWLDAQLSATKTLLVFCKEHGFKDHRIKNLYACFEALQADCVEDAVDEFKKIPLGGNGCFNDWWPDVVYDHENDEYVKTTFDALVEHWSRLMRLSVEALEKL